MAMRQLGVKHAQDLCNVHGKHTICSIMSSWLVTASSWQTGAYLQHGCIRSCCTLHGLAAADKLLREHHVVHVPKPFEQMCAAWFWWPSQTPCGAYVGSPQMVLSEELHAAGGLDQGAD